MTDDGISPTPIEVREDDRRREPARPRSPLDALLYRLALYRSRLAQRPPPPRDKPCESNPDDRATARTNHGLACAQRLDGDQSENWELAIAAFEDAISVWTRERNPEEWAAARSNLGVAYRERLAGDLLENKEQAIRAFEDALSVWTRERHPEEWAGACLNLGIAYWERLGGKRSENFERAIAAFEDALSVWTCEGNPDDWATARLNVGIAYRECLAGDRSENRERAIAAFKDALLVRTREGNPEEWAIARANLDIVYQERFGEWLDNRVTVGPVAAEDIKVIGLVSSARFMGHFFRIALPPICPLLKEAFGRLHLALAWRARPAAEPLSRHGSRGI
jgi:hypothetical protein